ncbi:MAG: RNA methyltransferase [Gemmatimonadota bacterium]|nr:RNA methyltransferase [Gemmatimonadota bacterium]
MARDLQRRRARERTGLFTAEGVRCVEELLASPLRLRSVLFAPALGQTDRGTSLENSLRAAASERGFEVAECSDDDLAEAAGTDTPQGIVAIAEQPERSFDTIGDVGCILMLDGVQDPGNVGTILRTAHAFAVAATIALPGTADLWNPKVVRSAMGALFSHVAFPAQASDAVAYLRERGIPIWATSAEGQPVGTKSGGERLAIVVGNEANGISPAITDAASRTVAIPTSNVESLNVAVATGILLYAITAT